MAGGQAGRVGGAVSHGQSIGGSRSKEYRSWLSMRRRCRQKEHYIRHGVTVCAAWDASFAAFIADVGPAPSARHTLDRYPNAEGNYEPGNVRWATMLQQRHNRRQGSRVGRPWLEKSRAAMAGAGNPSARLTIEQVRNIRSGRAEGLRVVDLARAFGVSLTTVKNIVAGKSWIGGADGHA